MNILRRIRNLWRISAYRMAENPANPLAARLFKDFPTVRKVPAKIIMPPERIDFFTSPEQ